MNNDYCALVFCDLNGLGLFQRHFQKAERFLFLKCFETGSLTISWPDLGNALVQPGHR